MNYCEIRYYNQEYDAIFPDVSENSTKSLSILSLRFLRGTCFCDSSIRISWVHIILYNKNRWNSIDCHFFHFKVGQWSELIWNCAFTVCAGLTGTRVTIQFELFSNEFRQCDWYLLPIEMRRMYMIFLLDTQNPIRLLSYANITCERETSKKVFISLTHIPINAYSPTYIFIFQMINTAFSYFMTVRRFRT